MKLSIMQPYLFPYIGYYQLINYSDKFIVYDDVQFIKRGWINRNKIILKNKEHLFSVPLNRHTSNGKILDLKTSPTFNNWLQNFYKTIERSYSKAPFYEPTLKIIKESFNQTDDSFVNTLLMSLKLVCNYLEITTSITCSSSGYVNTNLKGEERIISICRKEKASEYINLPGGENLYSFQNFHSNNISLQFIKPILLPYKTKSGHSISGLSIIDYLMNLPPKIIKEHLNSFKIKINDD